MAKKLYHIQIDSIKHYISINKHIIMKYINHQSSFELAKNFGKSYYEINIDKFFMQYHIYKDKQHAIKTLNIFRSFEFIKELYNLLFLEQFETTDKVTKEYQKSIFFSFVYFLFDKSNVEKEKIINKLFKEYFLHYISSLNKETQTQLNYKNMTQTYIKNKNIILKESYKTIDNKVVFKILINNQIKISLEGSSIKTLRKKAYKKIFFYLIEEHQTDKDDLEYKKMKALEEMQSLKTI